MKMNAIPTADSVPPQRRRPNVFDYEIGCDREGADRSFAMALVGDVGNTLLSSVRDGAARDVHPAQQNRAGDCRTLAGENFRQVLLTVPVDAGNTQDFAGPKIEADITRDAFAGLRSRCHAAEPEQGFRAPINSVWIEPSHPVCQSKASETARLFILAEHE